MVTSLKELMQTISGKKAPGPSTTFTVFHVFYSLELMSQKPIGRNKLAEQLQIGDGVIRTLISRLREAELIDAAKSGCRLTEKGRAVWGQFEAIFTRQEILTQSELIHSDFNRAFLVKNLGDKVHSGIEQRDAAIVAGARTALIIVYRSGHLCIQSITEDLEKLYPKAAKNMLDRIQPQENDVIVVAGAESALKAKRGAFAASWSLVSA
jgi:predicted transcriptional regulator